MEIASWLMTQTDNAVEKSLWKESRLRLPTTSVVLYPKLVCLDILLCLDFTKFFREIGQRPTERPKWSELFDQHILHGIVNMQTKRRLETASSNSHVSQSNETIAYLSNRPGGNILMAAMIILVIKKTFCSIKQERCTRVLDSRTTHKPQGLFLPELAGTEIPRTCLEYKLHNVKHVAFIKTFWQLIWSPPKYLGRQLPFFPRIKLTARLCCKEEAAW